jgi:glycosyltransferase involved in cell wall biosynthesis
MRTEYVAAATLLPTFSIITPSYNQAGFIRRTIESVLGQDYPALEYLIIDGGSTDGTLDILKEYQGRLQWISEKDRGQSDAINKGFQRATGDVFAYLNSDDLYEPGALRKVGAFFRNHPQAHWVTGQCRIIDDQDREIRRLITAYKNLWLRLHCRAALLVLDYISQPATFWTREAVHRAGPFDVLEHYSMDYDFSLRLLQHEKLWTLLTPLAAFRVHPASKSDRVREHFASDLEIARRYTRSPFLLSLHAAHNGLIVGMYGLLNPRRAL